jgi:uncharacterized protein DUF4238
LHPIAAANLRHSGRMTTAAEPRPHVPKHHHHVPRFLLAGWARTDGKLTVYTRVRARIVVSRRAPKHTAFEQNLYSVPFLPEAEREWVETEVLSKSVDGPAAQVHARLLNGECADLDSDARSAWTRFLMAQWCRAPDLISRMRQDSRDSLVRALREKPEEYEPIRGDFEEGSLVDWVDENAPNLHEFVALVRVFPKLINDQKAGDRIINMHWEVLRLDESTDLLISDRPAIRFEGLDSPKCLIMLPISPCRLFVASYLDRGFARVHPRKVAQSANRSTVDSATNRVYGTGPQHLPIVRKRMRPYE